MSVVGQVLDHIIRIDSSADIPASGLVPGQLYVDTSGNQYQADSTTTYVTKAGGSGSVTSINASGPTGIATWSGGPVTTSGTLTQSLSNQNANTFLAGPASGGATTPAFRSLVKADLPSPYNRYNPDKTPTSGLDANASDEYIGSVNTGLYTWGNQGTATATWELDTLRLGVAASASRDRKCLWYTMPSGDWAMSTKISGSAFTATPVNFLCGLIVLETGSIATPTSISMMTSGRNTSTTSAFAMYTSTSYTAAYTLIGTAASYAQQWIVGPPIWMAIRYVSSSKTISCWASFDGLNWAQVGSDRVLGADPINIGIFADQNTANVANNTRFHYLRTRTDATGTTTPYPIGE